LKEKEDLIELVDTLKSKLRDLEKEKEGMDKGCVVTHSEYTKLNS
jgi:hypothetical protein